MPRKRKSVRTTAGKSELLSRREAAEYLGLKEQTLAIWKVTGRYEIPVIKVGRLVKYRRRDLDDFLARRTQDWKTEEHDSPLAAARNETVAFAPTAEFAEVRLIENSEVTTSPPQTGELGSALEILLPSGIRLRVTTGSSLELLPSVLAMLER